ncbi:YrhB domain-containing protein [Pyxidicoccus trucidator]|uniref:YrhB domain-containing protein n=1 Tax=Pyxidicoccus trucidator TaxID=2709662 RepID=UPI0013DCDF51|nr:YrhB domain-containing protein [Pyxidicoccus trucidator]
MLTYKDALRIALAHLRPDCGLIESMTRELPFGWYFLAQPKQYLETGNPLHLLMGNGGFVVDRETGRVHEFGSAFPLERNLRMYAKGFRYQVYDLTITLVHDLKTTVRLLHGLGMSYVEPEEAYGVVWRVPQRYTESQLEQFLQHLPHTFAGHGFYFHLEVFEEMDQARCCTYELREHQPEQVRSPPP